MTGQFTVDVLQTSNAFLQTAASAMQTAILAIVTLQGGTPDVTQMAMVYDTDASVYAMAVVATYQEA